MFHLIHKPQLNWLFDKKWKNKQTKKRVIRSQSKLSTTCVCPLTSIYWSGLFYSLSQSWSTRFIHNTKHTTVGMKVKGHCHCCFNSQSSESHSYNRGKSLTGLLPFLAIIDPELKQSSVAPPPPYRLTAGANNLASLHSAASITLLGQ